MLTNTFTTAATLRSRSESPFVLPTGAMTWQLPVSSTGNRSAVTGYVRGTSAHNATLLVIKPTPMVGADARVATEQDRPPRGEPR